MADETRRGLRISIVMPNYNHGRYIGEALGAVLAQTRPADEIIVVDDASSDDSVEVVERLARGREEVILVRRAERGGAAVALEDGLRRATGDLVGFPAADDVVFPEFLDEVGAFMEGHPQAPFCSACVRMIDEQERKLGTRPILRPMRIAGYADPAKARALLLRGDNFFLGHVTLYRRERLLELGGFDPSAGPATDGILQRRLAVKWGFGFIPRILGYWRMHGANYSVGSSAVPEKLDGWIDQCKRIIASEERGLFPEGYAELFERRMRFFAARQALVRHRGVSRSELQTIFGLLHASPADRFVLGSFRHLGRMSATMSLGWLALRLRPMAISWLFSEYLHRMWPSRTRSA